MAPDEHPDPDLVDAEALLVALRPDLDAGVRDRIERRVVGRAGRSARRRLAPVLAMAGGLAALVLVLVAFGAHLFPSQTNVSQADPNCHWALKTVPALEPRIVDQGDGTRQLENRAGEITRFVRHCR